MLRVTRKNPLFKINPEEKGCIGWSSAREKIVEQAKEDLRILETQHPNRLEPLKLDLRSFINDMTFLDHHDDDENSAISCPSRLVSTQESTSKKKRKQKDERRWEESEWKLQRVDDDHRKGLEMKRVDLVLERARSCLRKLQLVKSSLVH